MIGPAYQGRAPVLPEFFTCILQPTGTLQVYPLRSSNPLSGDSEHILFCLPNSKEAAHMWQQGETLVSKEVASTSSAIRVSV